MGLFDRAGGSNVTREESLETALRRILHVCDVENQNCLPSCDRIAHDEFCSYANVENVIARIARNALGL